MNEMLEILVVEGIVAVFLIIVITVDDLIRRYWPDDSKE